MRRVSSRQLNILQTVVPSAHTAQYGNEDKVKPHG